MKKIIIDKRLNRYLKVKHLITTVGIPATLFFLYG